MFLHPQSVDALIFDMDGTLWNATASYAQVWNVALLQFGIEAHFTASDMLPFMGMPIELIMNGLLSQYTQLDHAKFLDLAFKLEIDMMPQLGGVLYPGVRDRLEKLSKFYKLFLLSNCGAQGLKNFMNFTGTQPLITDSISYGENPVPKSQNLGISDKKRPKMGLFLSLIPIFIHLQSLTICMEWYNYPHHLISLPFHFYQAL